MTLLPTYTGYSSDDPPDGRQWSIAAICSNAIDKYKWASEICERPTDVSFDLIPLFMDLYTFI